MVKITKEAALLYHSQGKPGKNWSSTHQAVQHTNGPVTSLLPRSSRTLSGNWKKDPKTAYDYTAKGNLVAVISNGTAVLGLGDIGALSGKPVMEGKGLLFKIYAGIDVFDIEVNEKDPEKFIQAVKSYCSHFRRYQSRGY